MNKLILLTIALALTPTVYAGTPMLSDDEFEIFGLERPPIDVIDRRKNDYMCVARYFPCQDLEEGDLLVNFIASQAVLYCDEDKPILEQRDVPMLGRVYSCRYNGNDIKPLIPNFTPFKLTD